MSPVLGAKQAEVLATRYGATAVVTIESLMKATGSTEQDASKEVTMLLASEVVS